ncbi:OmpA family protein [Ekhidna sp.]|uniref:OmpA family protein n=1 Tax=Ekhidna sp. TaxID=2608089 RepID=UPI0032973E92
MEIEYLIIDEWLKGKMDVRNKESLSPFILNMRFFATILLACSISFCCAQDQPQAYILKSIYFGGGSYYIDDYQLDELKQLIDSVADIRDYTITIHSHTDNIGGAEYNEWLSEMRGDAVIERLLNLDFKSNQIEKRDFGQFNPVYDNRTWEGRRRNRRVDIIFWPVVM